LGGVWVFVVIGSMRAATDYLVELSAALRRFLKLSADGLCTILERQPNREKVVDAGVLVWKRRRRDNKA
ncbi:hypothetical protein KCU82_g9, partial [Aureobasidium melanogenum]